MLFGKPTYLVVSVCALLALGCHSFNSLDNIVGRPLVTGKQYELHGTITAPNETGERCLCYLPGNSTITWVRLDGVNTADISTGQEIRVKGIIKDSEGIVNDGTG